MIRVAAAGDVHYDRDSRGRLQTALSSLSGQADLLVLAGDLTQTGSEEEIDALADDLASSPVPVVAVLGNHDYHSDRQDLVIRTLTEAGVTVLEQGNISFSVGSQTIGIAGTKGFGGGFVGASISEFGEPEMKAFIRITQMQSQTLRLALQSLDTDYKIALLHYSPCPDTLLGERREIYPLLGSYLLAEAIDQGGADVVFHGHAHHGVERGMTPGGIPVRNVAQPVIRHIFKIYQLSSHDAARDAIHDPVPST